MIISMNKWQCIIIRDHIQNNSEEQTSKEEKPIAKCSILIVKLRILIAFPASNSNPKYKSMMKLKATKLLSQSFVKDNLLNKIKHNFQGPTLKINSSM